MAQGGAGGSRETFASSAGTADIRNHACTTIHYGLLVFLKGSCCSHLVQIMFLKESHCLCTMQAASAPQHALSPRATLWPGSGSGGEGGAALKPCVSDLTRLCALRVLAVLGGCYPLLSYTGMEVARGQRPNFLS